MTDAKLGTLSCTPAQPATLAPGASLVCTGSYTLVLADINAGTVHNVARADSDQTPPTDTPNDVPLPKSVIIGDYVWWDQIRDGLQGSNEPGFPNVTVQLCTDLATCDSTGLVATVDTASGANAGKYEFRVPPGTYIVRIDPSEFLPGGVLSNWEATIPNVAGNTFDTMDSDGDPVTHAAPPVTLTAGQTDNTIDFGFAERRTGVTLAGSSVTATDGGVLVAWDTASELDIVGFSVVRGDVPVADFIAAEHAGASEGASYSVLDAAPGSGGYVLLIYKLDGSQERVELGS